MITNNQQWYALRTKSRAEFKAANYLLSRNVDCFCPASYEFRKWSDRTKRVKVAMFSQYFFAKVGCLELLSVCECQNIVGFVKSDGEPDPIPENQIKSLQEVCNDPTSYFVGPSLIKSSHSIVITNGPFTGQEAEIEHSKTEKIAIVRIGKGGMSLCIPLSQVEPLSLLVK